jgi:putative phage-type endonuclease
MMPAPRLTGPRKIHVRQGSPAWLEARKHYITATDMAAIEGVSPWRCEQDVADEKANGSGQESTLVMRVGSALEDLIAAAYSEETGRKVRRVHGLWESRAIPWAAASPDATAAGRLVELKWSGSRSRFASGLPEDVEVQARWQAMVAEAAVVDVAALVVGEDRVRIFTVERDAAIEDYLVAKAADFRRRLAEGGPFAQSLESIGRRFPRDNGAEMVADADLDSHVRALGALRARIRELEDDAKAQEKAVKERMGEVARLVGDGWSVSWKKAKDSEVIDWKSLATGLLTQLPEPDRAAVVGLHSTVREGARYFRVAWGKEDAS